MSEEYGTLRILDKQGLENDGLKSKVADLTAQLAAKDAVIAKLREGLEKCAAVLSGNAMSKSALIDALESARALLAETEVGK